MSSFVSLGSSKIFFLIFDELGALRLDGDFLLHNFADKASPVELIVDPH